MPTSNALKTGNGVEQEHTQPPDLPDPLADFFSKFSEPVGYDPASCLNDFQLQQIAAGGQAVSSHAQTCSYCSAMLAALRNANTSEQDRLHQFLLATRTRANAISDDSLRKTSLSQLLLARLRGDSVFRASMIAATAVIFVALAYLIANTGSPRDNSIVVNMQSQPDEVKFGQVMKKIQTLESRAKTQTALGQVYPQVEEINGMLRSLNAENLDPNERPKLAESVRELQATLNKQRYKTAPVKVAETRDVETVTAFHETLKTIPLSDDEKRKIDIKEIQPDNRIVVQGPFNDQQLARGSAVYTAFQGYANDRRVALDVLGFSTQTTIAPASFKPPDH